jgi:O-antigen/teichoic acid export membrane protein
LFKKLLKDKLNSQVFSLQIVQLIRSGVVFGVSIFLAQFYKDTEIISQYETLLLVGTGMTFFWVSGLMTTFLPYYNSKDEQTKKSVIFNSFISLSALSVLSLFAVILVGAAFYQQINTNLFVAYGVYVLFNSPSFLTEYILLVKNKSKAIVIYAVLIFSLQLLIFCLPLFLGYSLLIAVYALAVLAIVKFAITLFLVRKYGQSAFDFQLIKAYMSKSTPIMLTLLIGGSSEYVNGFIVRTYASDHEFAIFRYGAREFPLSRILANSLSLVFSGSIASSIVNGQLAESLQKLRKSTQSLMHVLFPMTVILLIISPYIFKFFYTDTFSESYKIFNVYLLLVVSRMLFPQTLLLGMQKNKLIMYASIVEFIINLVLGITFIHLFGILGVPFATLTSYYVYEIVLMFYVRREGIKLRSYSPIGTWLIYSVICWGIFLCI